jgi:hypothetical protein
MAGVPPINSSRSSATPKNYPNNEICPKLSQRPEIRAGLKYRTLIYEWTSRVNEKMRHAHTTLRTTERRPLEYQSFQPATGASNALIFGRPRFFRSPLDKLRVEKLRVA